MNLSALSPRARRARRLALQAIQRAGEHLGRTLHAFALYGGNTKEWR